jgi:hypothetical protein
MDMAIGKVFSITFLRLEVKLGGHIILSSFR